MLDYLTYPYTGTHAVVVGGGGWQFEIAVPKALLGAGGLTAGRTISATFGLTDDDGTGWWERVWLTAVKTLQMQ